jgi:hypothetical protein
MQSAMTSIDVHLIENVVTFFVGASLLMVRDDMLTDSRALMTYLEKYGCSYMAMVPSVWMHHIRSDARFPQSLRVACFGGEKMTGEVLSRLCRSLNDNVLMVNLYGPAECTIECTAIITPRDVSVIPIGRALSSHMLHISAPDGVMGELWIGGPCVMDGYKNAPNPCVNGWYPSGDVCYRLGDVYHYVGRRDFQVKLRGQRIELGEIEDVLGNQAVVVKDPARERLVAFVVCPESESSLSGSTFEKYLFTECTRRLPEYMVPSRIVVLESMPMNANGKADRKHLLGLLEVSDDGPVDASQVLTADEERVRQIWAEVLGMSDPHSLSVDVSFFSIGGHSLLAAQLAQLLNASLVDVYTHPTIRSQALALCGSSMRSQSFMYSADAVEVHEDQTSGPASFQQRQIYLHGQITGAEYLVPFRWELSSVLSNVEVNRVLASIPELRTSISLDPSTQTVMQRVTSESPRVEPIGAEDVEEWCVAKKTKIDPETGCVMFIAHVIGTAVYVGLVHHLVTDGLGLTILRRRMEERDCLVRSPSYLEYARC